MNELNELKPTEISTQFAEKLEHFFNAALKLDLPIAIWRLPGSDNIQAICQLDNAKEIIDQLETSPEGFVFSPFQKSEISDGEFIRADIRVSSELPEVHLNPTYQRSAELSDHFMTTMEAMEQGEKFDHTDYLEASPEFKSTKEEYVAVVEKCKERIEQGQYQKIVPSRRSKHRLSNDFLPVRELLKLCHAYQNAFISLVYIPTAGLWLGASPELLISVKDRKIFETISLAGTQEIPQNFNLAKAAWTQKEIEEQALVSRYIVNCFKQIRLREFEEFGPKTVMAGNLIHLKTVFKVDMDEVNFPQLGSVMLDLLHPTSAICGMPMIPAAEFLNANEGYVREFFSGYLGPVNVNNDINIYVNLRCARIYKNAGVLFAGAGVTEDSDAESEWNETDIKLQTLLNVIGK